MSSLALERSDHDLVAAVRRGDERAFEALYERYHRRIHAFVLGMVKDHGRAEDITQEVFVAGLRRMRATERPIAFKPWIYEIAKNACIDAFRRSRRAEEISYDAGEGLTPSDHRQLADRDATPDAALAAKQELETLCGAFGGLSDAHHEILVMRELEGRSYREIGERMGMSRPAVESTLFRARRRLSEEYGELVSGERCRRVQGIIAAATTGGLGARDARKLARHVAHCQQCRHEALACGLDRGLIARPPLRRRVAGKVGAWLPLPGFLRLRRGGGGAPDDGGALSGAVAKHLPLVSDQMSAGWSKLAAGVAVLLAGVSAGVGVHHAAGAHRAQNAPGSSVAAPTRTAARQVAAPAARPAALRVAGPAPAQSLRRSSRPQAATRTGGQTARKVTSPASAGTPRRTTSSPTGSGSPRTAAAPASSPRPASHASTPTVPTPRSVAHPVKQVRQTVQTVNATHPVKQVRQTVQTVNATHPVRQVRQTVQTVNQTVNHTVEPVAGGAPAAGPAGQAVQGAVNGATGAVNGVTGALPPGP